MAGLAGVLVAGGLLRRRGRAAASKASFPEAFPLAKTPVRMTEGLTDAPAWPLDDGAWHPCADALARALGVSGEEAEGGPEHRPEPPVRRGPSGREHFWSDPHAPFGG
ncbi:MAG: hypothetical protein EOO71_08775 [Myxococcaceae bacterium]|nr:MAG: hypothetical protein EOO71_08775 [Myxococcaceae bacterium]